MGSFDKTSYMLIRQYQFPDVYYRDMDILLSADDDRCFMWDYKYTRRCFTEHLGTGEGALERWAMSATLEKIMAFLKDILKADEATNWTGFRIMGTVNRANGFPVWTFQLFAKHPETDTKVYSGLDAPNVEKSDYWYRPAKVL